MWVSWRERLVQQPELRAFDNWPRIPIDSLSREYRKAFLRNQTIVAQALSGTGRFGEIARQQNISRSRVTQLLNRCLGGDSIQPPALTQGLIPHNRIVENQRQRSRPKLSQPRGSACAFKDLLSAIPALPKALDAMIEAKLRDAPNAQRLMPQALHGEFKRILAEVQWPQDQYPYTSVSVAYESVRRYLHRRTNELILARLHRKPSSARHPLLHERTYRAQRAMQIDEHTLDLNGCVHLALDGEMIPLRLARASVLLATDADTHCILGYALAPTRHPNQQDMLTLLDQCFAPWKPMVLTTPGFEYAPGACFPSGLEQAYPISFGTVQMDNALMHKAHSVIDLLCRQFGATLSLGLPAMPKARRLVESVFDYINKTCSHRFASTAGSGPADPKKESRKNQKRPPAVTFETINEALSVILAEYNITPQASLGGATPLALFEHQCAAHFVRYIPQQFRQMWKPFAGSKEVTLHWYKHEHRIPHVNFHGVRYQGPGLMKVADKTKRIRVEFDRRDIRTLQAFDLSGNALGELHAPASWRRYPHILATRQFILKNTKRHHFNARDPLAAYFRHLLENKNQPKTALSLLRVYEEFTAGGNGGLVLGDGQSRSRGSRHSMRRPKRNVWNAGIANHRG